MAVDPPPALDGPAAAEWNRKLSENPKLFDGPILSLISLDLDAGTICARRERYARLAAQPIVQSGVRLLSVTTAIVAHGSLLFLRRGPSVYQYPGLWEIGPSGGLSSHESPIRCIYEAMIRAAGADEIEEEIGLALPIASISQPIALLRDDSAASDDLVMVADASAHIAEHQPPVLNWENSRARWVSIAQLGRFAAEETASLTPPSRAFLNAIIG
ncbi:MAG: hypothetical protein PSX37_10055 [bacterium]|nr:hypothetical protein [bacterium]